MQVADQDEPVDAAFDQRAHHLGLLLQVVGRIRHQKRVAGGVQAVLQADHAGGEDRDVEGRHHGADGARAPRGERPGGAMGHVVQLVDRGGDAVA